MNIDVKQSRKLLIAGIIGCLLYVIGDYLYAATGRGQTTEEIGLAVKLAYLEMSTWRMVASIICGYLGTLLYYIGFHRMFGLLKLRIQDARDRKWLKSFRVAYIAGTVSWAYVHAMFMVNALIFKFVYQQYGDVQAAADIANRVFACNAAPMLIGFILCDGVLTVTMIVMVWKRIIPLKNTGQKILATLFNPLMWAGVVGNLIAIFPWPVDQLDHGTESFGHALVLVLGLVLLRSMSRTGDEDRTGVA